jgi:hypothetical protein
VAELENENSQVKTSNTKMQKTVDSSNEAVRTLRQALDEELENYELLKNVNDSLLEGHNKCAILSCRSGV